MLSSVENLLNIFQPTALGAAHCVPRCVVRLAAVSSSFSAKLPWRAALGSRCEDMIENEIVSFRVLLIYVDSQLVFQSVSPLAVVFYPRFPKNLSTVAALQNCCTHSSHTIVSVSC